MVDIDIEVVGFHKIVQALVFTGDKVLLGLDWKEEVGCKLDIPAIRLIMNHEHTQIFIQLQNITMKASTANFQISEPNKPTGPQGPQYRWNNFISYATPDTQLHLWDIPPPTQVSSHPRPVHMNSFLAQAHQDIEVAPHTQHIYASHIAFTCPREHYDKIQPWKCISKQPQCLVAHGFYV